MSAVAVHYPTYSFVLLSQETPTKMASACACACECVRAYVCVHVCVLSTGSEVVRWFGVWFMSVR